MDIGNKKTGAVLIPDLAHHIKNPHQRAADGDLRK
jgi:hypothetical protein